MRVVALYRKDTEVSVDATRRCCPATRCSCWPTRERSAVLAAIHSLDRPVRRVMIAGGGKVGLRLARGCIGQCQVKIIERDRKRCEYLATELPSDVLVLQGDGTDEDLLTDENVGDMDLFLALTSDDEDNILSAMLAKRMGARRVLALINRRAYADLMQGSTIDIAMSPAHRRVIGELLAHVRRGDVAAVHSLRRGDGRGAGGRGARRRKTSKPGGPAHRRDRSCPEGARSAPSCAATGPGLRGDDAAPRHGDRERPRDRLPAAQAHGARGGKLFQVSATFF
jgi:trk system potassium uptake protein TrkA